MTEKHTYTFKETFYQGGFEGVPSHFEEDLINVNVTEV